MRGVYPSGPECPPVWGESSEVAAARLVVSRVAWSLAALAPKKPLAFKEYTAGKYFGELGMLTARPRAAWIMAKTYCVLSASWVQERREREAERLCSERRAFASCRAQGASLPHCGDHAGRVPRGWRSSWEFPTEHQSNERHMASWMGAVLASCRPSQPWFNQWCESSNWSPSPGKLTCSIEIAESGSCFFCQFQASQLH